MADMYPHQKSGNNDIYQKILGEWSRITIKPVRTDSERKRVKTKVPGTIQLKPSKKPSVEFAYWG